MPGLADPYLKTARAKEHLSEIQDRLHAFLDSKPITITHEDDLENQRHLVRLNVKDIPEKIALVVGDFLYCLRSSLDQLLWALAHTTKPYPRNTQFPILEERDDKRINEWTRGVPEAAVAIIKSLQPYTGQDPTAVGSHLLWRLNLMCNIDKHRRVPTDKNVTITQFPDLPRQHLGLIDYDHDAGIISVPIFLKSSMRSAPTASLNVIFGDSHEGIECDIKGLEAIYEFVADAVLPKFLPFFG
jgi:hypothetical protein